TLADGLSLGGYFFAFFEVCCALPPLTQGDRISDWFDKQEGVAAPQGEALADREEARHGDAEALEAQQRRRLVELRRGQRAAAQPAPQPAPRPARAALHQADSAGVRNAHVLPLHLVRDTLIGKSQPLGDASVHLLEKLLRHAQRFAVEPDQVLRA